MFRGLKTRINRWAEDRVVWGIKHYMNERRMIRAEAHRRKEAASGRCSCTGHPYAQACGWCVAQMWRNRTDLAGQAIPAKPAAPVVSEFVLDERARNSAADRFFGDVPPSRSPEKKPRKAKGSPSPRSHRKKGR